MTTPSIAYNARTLNENALRSVRHDLGHVGVVDQVGDGSQERQNQMLPVIDTL